MVSPVPARSQGSITPFVALLAIAVGGLSLGLGRLGAEAAGAARARTAADAAALAGAAEGDEDAARRLAEANGGELVSFALEGTDVQVQVQVGDRHALARARRRGGTGGLGGATGVNGLVPELVSALDRAGALLGQAVPIVSGWRSPERQRALWENRGSNPFPVARPGTSMHERGRAVDVPRGWVGRLAEVAGEVGLCQPLPRTDPVHFELC